VAATATDDSGNPPVSTGAVLALDATPPVLTLTSGTSAPILVSPNGDGLNDTARLPFTLSEAATLQADVRSSGGAIVAP